MSRRLILNLLCFLAMLGVSKLIRVYMEHRWEAKDAAYEERLAKQKAEDENRRNERLLDLKRKSEAKFGEECALLEFPEKHERDFFAAYSEIPGYGGEMSKLTAVDGKFTVYIPMSWKERFVERFDGRELPSPTEGAGQEVTFHAEQ